MRGGSSRGGEGADQFLHQLSTDILRLTHLHSEATTATATSTATSTATATASSSSLPFCTADVALMDVAVMMQWHRLTAASQ